MDLHTLGVTGMYVIEPADISEFVMVRLGPWWWGHNQII